MLSKVSVRMSYRLSLLDKSPLAEGETAKEALARTLQLAKLADDWGYHRFWVAEHRQPLAGAGYRLDYRPNPAHSRRLRRRNAATLQPL